MMLSSSLLLSTLLYSLTDAAGTLTYTYYTTVTSTTTVTSSGYPLIATATVNTTVGYTTTTPRTIAQRVVTADPSTTTIYNVPTTVVPANPIFTPILLEPEYTAVYPTITSYIVDTATNTVGGSPTTTTTVMQTFSKATATAFSPVTATSTYTPVQFTVATTSAAAVTQYAACEVKENCIPFTFVYEEDPNKYNIRGTYAGDLATAKDCCIACQQTSNCIGTLFFSKAGGTCLLTVNNGVCTPDAIERLWDYQDEPDYGLIASNGPGPCGQEKPLLSNHPANNNY